METCKLSFYSFNFYWYFVIIFNFLRILFKSFSTFEIQPPAVVRSFEFTEFFLLWLGGFLSEQFKSSSSLDELLESPFSDIFISGFLLDSLSFQTYSFSVFQQTPRIFYAKPLMPIKFQDWTHMLVPWFCWYISNIFWRF